MCVWGGGDISKVEDGGFADRIRPIKRDGPARPQDETGLAREACWGVFYLLYKSQYLTVFIRDGVNFVRRNPFYKRPLTQTVKEPANGQYLT